MVLLFKDEIVYLNYLKVFYGMWDNVVEEDEDFSDVMVCVFILLCLYLLERVGDLFVVLEEVLDL